MNDVSSEPYIPNRSRSKAEFASKLGHFRALLIRRWWLLVLALAVTFAVDFALRWFSPATYFSIGRMIVSIKLSIPESSVYSEEMGSFLGTQAALMQSSAVLNRAQGRVLAEHPTFTNEPVQLKVNVTPRTSIFVLEASGAEPRFVQAFLQAAMQEYVALKKEMRTRTSDTTVAGLTEEVLKLERDLAKGEQELSDFQKSNSVVLLQEQGNAAGNYLALLNQQLARLKSEFNLLQTLTLDQSLEQRPALLATIPPTPDLPGSPAPPASPHSDSDYLKARQQLLLMKADLEDLGRYLRPKHPKVIALSEEISRRERLLDIFKQQSTEQLENHKSSLALQIKNLEKDVAEWNARALEVSSKSAEFQRLRSNVQRTQSLYDRLLATLQTLDVNKEINPESVTIMEPASTPFAAKPNDLKHMVTVVLVGALIGLGLVLFSDYLDDRIMVFKELQEIFEEPVLVQIPRERGRAQNSAALLRPSGEERYALIEAYRNFRSSLLYMDAPGKRPRTLLITSSIPNEGKSLTASNLAITLANAQARVLLIDADLRKGVLHHRFGMNPAAGLSEALTTSQDWRALVRDTQYPGLSLLPRGEVSNRSSELFLGERIRKLLQEAAAAYDFVLIDTPPIMAADDVTSLAPLSDATLFVVRAEHTSARVARAAMELLYQRRVQVLGIVFNAVRRNSIDYHYYKYADYYQPQKTNGQPQPATAALTGERA